MSRAACRESLALVYGARPTRPGLARGGMGDDGRMAGYSRYRTKTRGTLWRATWYEDGQPRQKRGFVSRTAAEAWVRGPEGPEGAAAAGWRSGRGITVAEGWAAWTRRRAAGWAPSTAAGYARHWRLYVEPVWGRVPVAGLRASAVQDWADALAVSQGPGTARQAVTTLRGALRGAALHGAAIPAGVSEVRAVPRRRRRADMVIPSAEQIVALSEAARRGPEGDIRADTVRILAATGLRWGELAGMRAGDVDIASRRARVERAATPVDGEMVVGPPKGGQARTIALPGSIVATVEPYTRRGWPWLMSPDNPRRSPGRGWWWAAAVERVAAEDDTFPRDVTPHDLRHFAASTMLAAGLPLAVVARQLGHRSPAVTLGVYAHTLPDDLDAIAAM